MEITANEEWKKKKGKKILILKSSNLCITDFFFLI